MKIGEGLGTCLPESRGGGAPSLHVSASGQFWCVEYLRMCLCGETAPPQLRASAQKETVGSFDLGR